MRSAQPAVPGVLVLGDINVDILGRLDVFTGMGGDNLAPELELHCGGVGANVALGLTKWGVPVRLLGCTGRDWFGDYALQALQRGRVDFSFVQRTKDALTGLMFIAISPDGQRTMFGCRGANAHLAASELSEDCWQGIGAVHLVGYNFLSPSTEEAAWSLLKQAHHRRLWVSLDVGRAPSQQVPDTLLQVARQVDILFATVEEGAALTGEADELRVCGQLESSGVRDFLLKRGEKGCLVGQNEKLHAVPPFSTSAKDTTGAGDALCAAFLRARLHGWSQLEAALLGNAAGATAVSVIGAGEEMPGPKQVRDLVAAGRLPAEWESLRVRVLERLTEELGPSGSADPR